MRPFEPLVRNPHLLTVAANLWRRRLDCRTFHVTPVTYRTEPGVQVLVEEQRPAGEAAGELVLLHGLEGSSLAGYMRSLAQAALEAGFAAHRVNMRNCGGTEALCPTMYHAGLSGDLLAIVRCLQGRGLGPIHLAGFSLGGNVVLKLAGELGEDARGLVSSVCAISTPLDLGACAERLAAPENWLYEWRFLRLMKRRLRRKHALFPNRFSLDGLDRARTIVDIDDRFTGPSFGFRDAAEYYATQSAVRFLERIRVPVLLVQAKDDPLIPFRVFAHPAIASNPYIRLLAQEHGGHMGFLSRRRPRFWVDGTVIEWLRDHAKRNKGEGNNVLT